MSRPKLTRRLLLAACVAVLGAPLRAQAADVTVFAAASMKGALDAVAADWTAQTGAHIAISYAGSSVLARQIQQGAPADIFISADLKWMDVLQKAGAIKPDSRRNLLGNALVLVAHDPKAAPVTLAKGADLAGLLGPDKLAMALVDSVPAGIYGKASLTSLGVWDSVATKVAQADNVRAALALVSAGEAPYGIVYATDAAAERTVTVVGTFPADSHPPIVYPAALTTGAQPGAAAFLAYLSGPKAGAEFRKFGFTLMEK